MKIRWKHAQTIVLMLSMLLLLAASACSNGDDDDSDDSAGATSTATTAASSSADDSTPTTADTTEATGTTAATEGTDGTATATEDNEDAATATTRSEATASPTEAPDDEPSATATSGGSGSTSTEPSGSTTPATGDIGGDLPEFETLDPELLPNFSMRMNFDATNLSDTPQTTLVMQMEQSEIDRYHLNMESDGELLEFWTIGESSWTSLAGEVIESPTGPLFSPADILTTGEIIPEGLEAREEGTEEINGRETTKWVTDGADYVAFMNEDENSTVEMTDGTGEVVIWIDNELNIMLKAEGDVAWLNGDGTEGSLIYDYEIFDIGSTAEVQAPQ